jgi:hypothetical protein
MYSQWSLTFGPPNQNPVNTSALSHACHMSRPPHRPSFTHPNNIRWRIQAVKFVIMQFSPRSVFLPFGSKYPQHCSQKPSVYVPPSKWETKFRTHTPQPAKFNFVYSLGLLLQRKTYNESTRHTVGLHGRGTSTSQGLYLYNRTRLLSLQDTRFTRQWRFESSGLWRHVMMW